MTSSCTDGVARKHYVGRAGRRHEGDAPHSHLSKQRPRLPLRVASSATGLVPHTTDGAFGLPAGERANWKGSQLAPHGHYAVTCSRLCAAGPADVRSMVNAARKADFRGCCYTRGEFPTRQKAEGELESAMLDVSVIRSASQMRRRSLGLDAVTARHYSPSASVVSIARPERPPRMVSVSRCQLSTNDRITFRGYDRPSNRISEALVRARTLTLHSLATDFFSFVRMVVVVVERMVLQR